MGPHIDRVRREGSKVGEVATQHVAAGLRLSDQLLAMKFHPHGQTRDRPSLNGRGTEGQNAAPATTSPAPMTRWSRSSVRVHRKSASGNQCWWLARAW